MHLTYLLFVPVQPVPRPREPRPRGPEDEPVGEDEEIEAPPDEESDEDRKRRGQED